jgi:hypothetical protein
MSKVVGFMLSPLLSTILEHMSALVLQKVRYRTLLRKAHTWF